MLLRRRSLTTNIALMAGVIGVPYALLWAYLVYTGRIGIDIIAVVSVLLLVDAAVLFVFVRGLVMPLNTVSQVMKRVAQGDFTADIDRDLYGGQIGKMLEDVRTSIHANRDMMESILANTVDIASSSFETVHASAKVVFNVEEEENHVLSISDASRQITETVSSSAEAAANAHDVAQNVNEQVVSGHGVVKQSIDSMSQLADTVGDAAGKVEALGESSKRIGEITEVINDIAEQTNLLALNAAIEAARAGEHGRGFAVVADEVRSLAERTSKATHEIDQMIHTIQSETNAVIDTMRTGVERAESGKEAALHSGQTFDAISRGIDEVTGLIAQIASAAEQQRVSTQEIAESIQHIATISTGNTQQANHAVDIIQEMNEVIGGQLKTLDAYQIPHKALLVAKSDHMLWKKRLTEVVLGRTRMETNEVADDHSCRFGKWYFAQGQEQYGYKDSFRAIQEPHREIHDTARQVIDYYNRGDKQAAVELLEGLSIPTGKVLENLERIRTDAKIEDQASGE